MKRITRIDAVKNADKKKLRVAAYARVSTDSDDQLVSLETQKNHYERYIKARPDWEYAGLYFDEGISGLKLAKRDGLMRLISDCEKGLIDYIIVKSLSRFSRNTVDSIELVRKLSSLGIYIFFEKENVDTGKMEGELLLSILSSLAESESRSISENETWSIQRRFQNGTFKIGYPPYGYINADGEMLVDEEQAEIVRWIFAEVLAGRTPGNIAKELNSRGIPSKRGGKWESHVINGMIRNEKYTGDVILQKTFTDGQFNRHTNRGERNMYLIKDHHQAIVSHEDFDAANAIIDRNGMEKGIRKDDMKYQNRYAFSGKIICGDCGSTWKRRKLNGYFGYVCNLHLNDKDACTMLSIPEDKIKAAFVTMMNKLIFARDKVLLPYADGLKGNKTGDVLSRLEEIEVLLESNAKRKNQLFDFFSKSLLDPAVFAKENDALALEEKRLTDEKNALSQGVIGSEEQIKAVQKLLRYASKGEMLTDFDEELFTEHVDHIVVLKRDEIGFAMKCGPVFEERV